MLKSRPIKSAKDAEVKEAITALQARHQPIARHFFSGAGIRFQFLDSEIAALVIRDMILAKAPLLIYHDASACKNSEAIDVTSLQDRAKDQSSAGNRVFI